MPNEMIHALQQFTVQEVQYFLSYHSYANPSSLSSTIDNLADIHCKKLVQTSLNDFL